MSATYAIESEYLALPTKSALSKDEHAKLFRASQILCGNLQQSPSVKELAKQTGLTEATLKQGFQDVFGVSVDDYLRIQRMFKARALLVARTATVEEVARAVGYPKTHEFVAKFKATFGVAPE